MNYVHMSLNFKIDRMFLVKKLLVSRSYLQVFMHTRLYIWLLIRESFYTDYLTRGLLILAVELTLQCLWEKLGVLLPRPETLKIHPWRNRGEWLNEEAKNWRMNQFVILDNNSPCMLLLWFSGYLQITFCNFFLHTGFTD